MVDTSTFLSDTILFIRDDLRDNVTDPISSSRPSSEKFVMTSYPNRPVTYPIVTVKGTIDDSRRLGQQSTHMAIQIRVEVRCWGRNEKEKNQLFDSTFDRLRASQYLTAGSVNAELHDFTLTSAVDVDDPGEEGIKSKVSEYTYLFITR